MFKFPSFTDIECKFTNVLEGIFVSGEPRRILLLFLSSLSSLGSLHSIWLDPVEGRQLTFPTGSLM